MDVVTADARHPGLRQHMHRPCDELRIRFTMCREQHQDLPAGGFYADVESRSGLAGGVVDDATPRMGLAELLDGTARSVGRSTVDHDHVEQVRRIGLTGETLETIQDVAGLVQHRYDD